MRREPSPAQLLRPNCRSTGSPERAGRIMLAEAPVRFETFSFGSVRIDGVTYDHDVVIDRGEVRKRKKKPSKKFREAFGHTPLSFEEEMPWRCRRLMICTGSGALPVLGKCSEKPSAARSNS